jgi:hypothetical protein
MSMRERIAQAILKDLSDRRGIRHALECVDDDVMQEIREALADAVLSELLTPTEGMVFEMQMAPIKTEWVADFGNGAHEPVTEPIRISWINKPDDVVNDAMAAAFTAAIQAAKEGK